MQNLKPFNLERALAGDPVVTRDGRPVTQLTYFRARNTTYKLIGVVDDDVESWSDRGETWSKGGITNSDLFMAPKTRTVWVNLYPSPCSAISGNFVYHESEERADISASASPPRIGNKAFPIEIEE